MGAVNDAIRRLAAAMPDVQIVPLDEIFGPKYKDEINGRQVRDPTPALLTRRAAHRRPGDHRRPAQGPRFP